jgi:hypothetical protein
MARDRVSTADAVSRTMASHGGDGGSERHRPKSRERQCYDNRDVTMQKDGCRGLTLPSLATRNTVTSTVASVVKEHGLLPPQVAPCSIRQSPTPVRML